jgi:hypothetical protein
LLIILAFSCDEAVNTTFSESTFEYTESVLVEVNIPKADGESNISAQINSTIENHIANMLNFSEDVSDTISLKNAITKFEKEYEAFKSDFQESSLVWEAMFDGEVTYHSPLVITIAINSYLNTGGAHGNLNISLFNFDTSTGKLLSNDKLISNHISFSDIAKKHFKEHTNTQEEFGDYFFGEAFHLPANIGYNKEGVLLFYNVYEIASYAIGVTEFTIPFEEVEDFLSVF